MDAEFWGTVVGWIPAGIIIPLFLWIHFSLWRDAKKNAAAWDEEQERLQRVKDLSPEQPSYEERMGVSYGHDQDE